MKFHFGHKLALIMMLLVIVASCIVGYTMVFRQFRLIERQFADTGSMLASQMSAGSVEPVFTEDKLSLLSLVNSLKEQSRVVSAAFISREGEILAKAGLPVPVYAFAGKIASKTSGFVNTDNTEIVWFYSPVVFKGVVGATAWVALDKSEYIAARNGMIRSGIIVVALLILSIALVAIRLGRLLGRPVRDLIRGTRAIESGNYGFRILANHGGEFKKLTKAFNSMAEGLEQKTRVESLFSRFVSNPVAARYLAGDSLDVGKEGKRVKASVLFVDLAGYTEFSQGRRPEETAEVLNLYFREFADICHECNGNVDKYIGDCAMMIFGCPKPDESHGFHAMQCAIMLRLRVEELNRQRRAEGRACLNIRIGISGGTVLAGLLGSQDRLQYTVIGEPANLAARLCELAPVGHIMTDRKFYEEIKQVRPMLAYEAGSITVKGFKQAVEAMIVEDWVSEFHLTGLPFFRPEESLRQ